MAYADLPCLDSEIENATTLKFEMEAQEDDLDSDLDFTDSESEMDSVASMEDMSLDQAGHLRQSEKKELELELELLLEDQQQWEQGTQQVPPPLTPATPLPTYYLLSKKKGKKRNSVDLPGSASATMLTCAENCSSAKRKRKGKKENSVSPSSSASRVKLRLFSLEGKIHQYVNVLQCRKDADDHTPLNQKQNKKLKEMRIEADEIRRKVQQEEKVERREEEADEIRKKVQREEKRKRRAERKANKRKLEGCAERKANKRKLEGCAERKANKRKLEGCAECKANKGKAEKVTKVVEDTNDTTWPELMRQKAALKVEQREILNAISLIRLDPKIINRQEKKRKIKDLKLKQRKSDVEYQLGQLNKLEKRMRICAKEAQNQVSPVVRLVELSKMISIWREAKHSELQELQCFYLNRLFSEKKRTNDIEISDAELSDCSPDHTEDVLQKESFNQNLDSKGADKDFDVKSIPSTFTDVGQDDPVTCVSQENACRPVGKIQGKARRHLELLERNKQVIRQIDNIVMKTRYFSDVDDSCFLVKRLANMLLERRQQRNVQVAPDSVAGQLKERNMARNVAVDQLVTQMAATLKLTPHLQYESELIDSWRYVEFF